MGLTRTLDHHHLRFEQKEPRVLAFLPEAGESLVKDRTLEYAEPEPVD